MFEKLKQAARAMSPANIKRGIELSRQSMANADRIIEEELARRVLLGPAGDYL